MSSSNRGPLPCGGVLFLNDVPSGPIMLPEKHPDRFVQQFNQQYRSAGMRIEMTEKGDDVLDANYPSSLHARDDSSP